MEKALANDFIELLSIRMKANGCVHPVYNVRTQCIHKSPDSGQCFMGWHWKWKGRKNYRRNCNV